MNKEELKQSFCGHVPFLSPTSISHSLDLIFSLTTKTPEQGRVKLCGLSWMNGIKVKNSENS